MKAGSLKNSNSLFVLALAGAFAAACGGASTPAEAPPSGGEEAPEAEASEEAPEAEAEAVVKFDDMSPPEKMKLMKTVVAPGMAKIFQGADAEKYAEFDCTSCHGPGAKDGNFHMPTKDLPVLNMAEIDWEAPVVKFMAEQVVPEMAKMLGEEPYNEETKEGFGCMGCHTAAE